MHWLKILRATLSGVPLPGISLGDALDSLKKQAKKLSRPVISQITRANHDNINKSAAH